MAKIAADVAASPSSAGDIPSVDILLREGSFYQRLERARVLREAALAQAATESGGVAERLQGSKPWEKSDVKRPAVAAVPSQKVVALGKTDSFPLVGRATPPVNPDIVISQPLILSPPVLTPAAIVMPDAPAAEIGPTPRKIRSLVGFALGLGFGLLIATLAPLMSGKLWSNSGGVDAVLSAAAPTLGAAGVEGVQTITVAAPGDVAMVRQIAAMSGPTGADASAVGLAEVPPTPQVAAQLPSLAAADVPNDAGLVLAALDAQAAGAAARSAAILQRPGKSADAGLRLQVSASAIVAAPGAATIRIMAPQSITDKQLTQIEATMKAAGYAAADIVRVNTTVKSNQVRYYFATDRALAAALAGTMGGVARDFTKFSPLPPAGTIEVWYAGLGPQPAKAKKPSKKTKRKVVDDQQMLDALRQRLLQQLQGVGN